MATPMIGFNTLKEIQSQPLVWEKSLHRLSGRERANFPQFNDYDQVVFTGCGSRYYLSLWAARYCEEATSVMCRAASASDLILHPQAWLHFHGKTLLVAISRSAETTETILALKVYLDSRQGEATVVTCYLEGSLAQLTPWVVDVPDSQEISVAQTWSFTNMMLAVIWLVTGSIPAELPGQIAQAGKDLFHLHASPVKQVGTDQKLSKVFFLGSEASYGLATGTMLKMKEMSLAHSESLPILEFRHGPMSLVDQESLVIGLLCKSSREYEYAVMKEMGSKGTRTIGILDPDDSTTMKEFDDQIIIPRALPKQWRAPLVLPILQLIAYEKSISNGLDPDHPTNLTAVVVLHE